MARPIPNADEHLLSLTKRSRDCVNTAISYIQIARPAKVHLYSQDVTRIADDLRGSGFDLGRGFKICGIKVEAVDLV